MGRNNIVEIICQYGELSTEKKYEVVEIFLDGFGHFMTFTKDKDILRTMVYHAINQVWTYVLVEDEEVLGLIALATNKIRPIKFDKEICIELFGKFKGNLLCKEMNAIFQSQVVKEDNDLYIDVLATAKQSRGKGVATRLLEYSFNLPGYTSYYIEVMSKNITAKRLYGKMGFAEYKKCRVSPLAFRGFGYPIKMHK